MDYSHISDFLHKLKQNLFKKREKYEVIAEVIEKHIGINIDINCIKIKGNIINIQSSPIIKNEILIHKNGILKDLEDLIPDNKFINLN